MNLLVKKANEKDAQIYAVQKKCVIVKVTLVEQNYDICEQLLISKE